MKGIIRTRERCVCGGKFEFKRVGREDDLFCSCGQRPRTYYIYLHWKGDHKIVQDKKGLQLRSYMQTNRLLERIRSEIDAGTFDINEYKQKTRRQFDARRLIRKWYKGKVKKHLAPTTLKDYRGYIRNYFSPAAQKFLSSVGQVKVENRIYQIYDCQELRTYHITNFFESLTISPVTRKKLDLKTKKNILVALKNFTDWLTVQGVLSRDIILTYPEFDVPEPEKIWTKQSKALQILPFVPVHDQKIIEFLLRHPLRSGESVVLLREDFNIEEGFVRIDKALSGKKIRHRKNKKGYLLAISENYDTSFLKTKFPKALAFINAKGNMYRSSHLARIWRKASEIAVLATGDESLAYIPLKYSGRTTIATEALNRGVPIEHVAGALGDSREVTNKHYAHLQWRATKAVIDGK